MSTRVTSRRMRESATKRRSQKWMSPEEWHEHRLQKRNEQRAREAAQGPTITVDEWKRRKATAIRYKSKAVVLLNNNDGDGWTIIQKNKTTPESRSSRVSSKNTAPPRTRAVNQFKELANKSNEKKPATRWERLTVNLRPLHNRKERSERVSKPVIVIETASAPRPSSSSTYPRGWVGRVAKAAGCSTQDASAVLKKALASPDGETNAAIIAAATKRHPQLASRQTPKFGKTSFPSVGRAVEKNVPGWTPTKWVLSPEVKEPAAPPRTEAVIEETDNKHVQFNEEDEYFSDDSYSEHYDPEPYYPEPYYPEPYDPWFNPDPHFEYDESKETPEALSEAAASWDDWGQYGKLMKSGY